MYTVHIRIVVYQCERGKNDSAINDWQSQTFIKLECSRLYKRIILGVHSFTLNVDLYLLFAIFYVFKNKYQYQNKVYAWHLEWWQWRGRRMKIERKNVALRTKIHEHKAVCMFCVDKIKIQISSEIEIRERTCACQLKAIVNPVAQHLNGMNENVCVVVRIYLLWKKVKPNKMKNICWIGSQENLQINSKYVFCDAYSGVSVAENKNDTLKMAQRSH